MESQAVVNVKEVREDGSIIQLVVWLLADPVPPCEHRYKYRLYYGVNGVCRVRYDNERGKGDHKHLGKQELPYRFISVSRLLADFRRDVERWEAS